MEKIKNSWQMRKGKNGCKLFWEKLHNHRDSSKLFYHFFFYSFGSEFWIFYFFLPDLLMFLRQFFFLPCLWWIKKISESSIEASGRSKSLFLHNYHTISFLLFFFFLEDSRESVLVRRTRKLKLGRRD